MDPLNPAQATHFNRVKAMIRSREPKVQELVKRAGEDILNCKLLSPGSVHNNATLSNLSVMYQNEELIGTKLLPVVNVPMISGTFFKYGQRDRRAVPDDAVLTRSRPNEIIETRSTDTYSCKQYALTNYIDEMTLRAADAPLNEMVDLIQSINAVIDLSEEMRIADVLTTGGNYLAANTVTLSGADQWNSGSGGDPVDRIIAAVDAVEMGDGASKLIGFCDVSVARVLRKHAAILDLFKNVSTGLASMKMVAAFFGLDDILVGRARKDTANIGQTAVKARVWGDCFGVLRVATAPTIRSAAFGYTLRFGVKATDTWFEQGAGIAGGYMGRVGLAEDHKICADDCGFVYLDCVA